MPVSPADQEILAAMRQRGLHLKQRERAADTILYEVRRYRAVLVFLTALAVTVVATGIFLAVGSTLPERSAPWRLTFVEFVVGAALGVQLGQRLLRTRRGQRLLANKESRLRDKYSGDLHAGRRWLQFYFQGEDIAAYVPQVLYFIEQERRFESVQEALDFAKSHRRESTMFAERALDRFNSVAAQTNLATLSSADQAGRPSSRLMRFVRSDRPGVWYVTTAAEAPKVQELDVGRIALVTAPTESGATISSNRIQIRRTATPFPEVAELYRTQVPGYADGMTEAQQEHELVYELTMQSARVDTWLEREVVEF